MSPTRGVVWIVWGEKADGVLARSRESVKRTNPELAQKVFRLEVTDPVLGLAEKARMFDLSPFDETLFLDADTVVLGKLDFAFEKARQHGLAACICECPWARRYRGAGLPPDTIEVNTGVLAFSRMDKVRRLFERWKDYAGLGIPEAIDSSILWVKDQATGELVRMAANDQGGFAAAMEAEEFCPYVLPMNWNLRPSWQKSWFGPVRVWHSYEAVPTHVVEAAAYYEQPGSVVQYHHLDGTMPLANVLGA